MLPWTGPGPARDWSIPPVGCIFGPEWGLGLDCGPDQDQNRPDFTYVSRVHRSIPASASGHFSGTLGRSSASPVDFKLNYAHYKERCLCVSGLLVVRYTLVVILRICVPHSWWNARGSFLETHAPYGTFQIRKCTLIFPIPKPQFWHKPSWAASLPVAFWKDGKKFLRINRRRRRNTVLGSREL